MPQKTSAVAPSLIRSSVTQSPKPTATPAEILETIAQLKKERQAQAQYNYHARLSRDEAEQYAAIATHHAHKAERSAQQADRIAKSMPDPLAIILISIGTSILISLAIHHLSKTNEPPTFETNIRTGSTRSGG